MFTWFKVLRKLSKQEDFLAALDAKMQELSQLMEAQKEVVSKGNLQIQEFETKIIESQEKFTGMKEVLQKEINAFDGLINSSKAEFAQLSGQLDTYAKNVR